MKNELARQHAEVLQLAVDGGASAATTARIADLHDNIARGETRLVELRGEVAILDRERLEPEHVDATFADFDNVWNALSLCEQDQVLALLVDRVEFDAADSNIAVTFHPSAIKALVDGQAGEAA